MVSIDFMTPPHARAALPHGRRTLLASRTWSRSLFSRVSTVVVLYLCLMLCLTTANAYTSPLSATPGYWSFAVRNDAMTMVVFPAWWPTLGSSTSEYFFEVQKSRHRYERSRLALRLFLLH